MKIYGGGQRHSYLNLITLLSELLRLYYCEVRLNDTVNVRLEEEEAMVGGLNLSPRLQSEMSRWIQCDVSYMYD